MKKFLLIALVFSGLALVLDACRKPSKPILPEELVLRDRALPVGATGLEIDFAASDFTTGILVFNMIGSTPNVKVGDILVSGEGDGYIRRVTAISVNGSVYTITTTQATLEDVFIQGHLVFDFDLNFLKTGKNLGLIDSVLARTLYKDASLSVVLSAQLQYAPTFHYDFWFDTAGIASCDITATNASYSSSASVKVTATQAASLLNRTDTLRKYNKIYRSWNLVNGYPTPVVVRLDLSWVAEYSVVTESTVSSTYTFSGVGPQTLGAKYEGGPWKSTYTFNPNQNTSTSQAPGVDDVEVKVTCRPVLAFKIMGVPGPHVTVGLKSEVAGRLANATGDWDLTAESWHETSQKISGTIFGKNVPDLAEEIWETNKVGFSTPNTLAEISGNNQRAFEGQPLPNPIKVKVTDSKGLAVKGVPVHFELAANHGTATPATVYTDVNGFAQTNWTLGSRLAPVQHMDVSARRGDLSEIISSPIGFTAIIDTPITCTTMIDKDGNSYPGLIIGGRCWDTRNLTSTKYGVSGNPPITQVQDSSAWVLASQLGTEAWCNFQSDPAYGVRNGKLYNWYAVNNANVCPVGWHVPTRTEYQAMFDSLGGNAAASKKIKMNVLYPNNASVPDTGWGLATTQPPLDANNISGFSAASVGSRSEISIYSATDYQDTYFWTSSPVNANTAYAVELKRGISSVTFVTRPKGRGYSVRCIKN